MSVERPEQPNRTLLYVAALIGGVGLLLLGVAAVRMAFDTDDGDGPTVSSTIDPTMAPPTQPAEGDADGVEMPTETVPADEDDAEDAASDARDADAATQAADDGESASPSMTPADPAAEIARALGDRWAVVRLVVDWPAGADDDPDDVVSSNLGIGDNEMTLSWRSAEAVPGPLSGMEIDWQVGAEAPDDFVGFDYLLPEVQSWTGATHIAVWADRSASPEGNFVVQFREDPDDEVWRYEGPLDAVPAPEDGPLLIPLEIGPEAFQWAPWSREADGRIDLDGVDQVGIYVGHGGPGLSGALRIGALAAVRRLSSQ